jgi:hypothetical protein
VQEEFLEVAGLGLNENGVKIGFKSSVYHISIAIFRFLSSYLIHYFIIMNLILLRDYFKTYEQLKF